LLKTIYGAATLTIAHDRIELTDETNWIAASGREAIAEEFRLVKKAA
jgi:hypothetical protein